jgi:hypothetical protein
MSEIQYLPLDVEAMLQARLFSESECLACIGQTELCPPCQDLKDSRDINIAHQIVDEGNLQYEHIWSNGDSTVSGHDWVGSVTKLSKPVRDIHGNLIEERYEFLPPITNLTDRFMDLETSMTVLDSEVICQSCHLLYNKHQADCPVCF